MQPAPERLIIRSRMEEICSAHSEWKSLGPNERETLIRRMERNCFDVTIYQCKADGIERLFSCKNFINRYSTNCSRVLANLDINGSIGSDYLLKKIISGEIDPYTVAEMPARDLCPEANQHERDEIARRLEQKAILKVSTAHICRKCGENKTTFIDFQAKAADEGSSLSIKCVVCGFVWQKK